MGTSNTRSHFTGSQALTTSYASVGDAIDVGGYDSILVQVLFSSTSLTQLSLAFLADNAALMKSNSDGDTLIRDEVAYAVSGGSPFSFRMNTKGMKNLTIQAKGDIADGNMLGIIIAPEGTDNKTPVAA